MPWDVKYVADTCTVEVSGAGKLSLQDALSLVERAAVLVNERGATRVLSDYSDAVADVAKVDIHGLPEFQDTLERQDCVSTAWNRVQGRGFQIP
jgi:hypothetical protein